MPGYVVLFSFLCPFYVTHIRALLLSQNTPNNLHNHTKQQQNQQTNLPSRNNTQPRRPHKKLHNCRHRHRPRHSPPPPPWRHLNLPHWPSRNRQSSERTQQRRSLSTRQQLQRLVGFTAVCSSTPRHAGPCFCFPQK